MGGLFKRKSKKNKSKNGGGNAAAAVKETPIKTSHSDEKTATDSPTNSPASLQNGHVDNGGGRGDYDNDEDCAEYENFRNRARRPRDVLEDDAALANPTMEMVPDLVEALETAEDPGGERSARALRSLFALSEHSTAERNRERMVRDARNARLVPALLDFLERCERSSSEQYLALLVLNNVSIPAENKRPIAVERGGARVLSRLLCEDPSCHLLAIILVNLTFADAALRRELVDDAHDVRLVDALAYALLESSSTPEEQDARPPHRSPRDALAASLVRRGHPRLGDAPFDPDRQTFPETARWCLSALKNLTRPSGDASIARAVVESGILPTVLRIVEVGDPSDRDGPRNPPRSWEANSIQDAALFTVLNLAASAGEALVRTGGTVETLGRIVDYASMGNVNTNTDGTRDEDWEVGESQQQFQCLKARMALAYLVGSPESPVSHDTDCLLVTNAESERLLELLANALHGRAKTGPGGYSAATFSVASVLRAIRCLLTCLDNRTIFAATCGVRLNCLLIKAAAHFCADAFPTVDVAAADHAVQSLYGQSDYGFRDGFLPRELYDPSLAVVSSCLHVDALTAAGRRAAEQLTLRHGCLLWTDAPPSDPDCRFDAGLRSALEGIRVDARRAIGTRPLADVFDRPVVRTRRGGGDARTYASALHASHDVRTASTSRRDDIVVANNVASRASGNDAEDYGFDWRWQDAAATKGASSSSRPGDRRAERTSSSTSTFRGFVSRVASSSTEDDQPLTIFGLRCGQGGFCAS